MRMNNLGFYFKIDLLIVDMMIALSFKLHTSLREFFCCITVNGKIEGGTLLAVMGARYEISLFCTFACTLL